MTSDRVTIMMDSEIAKKIRVIQSRVIHKSNANYSFSRAVNDVLREGLV